MSFTFHLSDGTTSSPAGTTLDLALTGVTAGDLIVAWMKWETNNSLATFAEVTGGSKPADGYGASTGDFVAGSYFGRYAYILSGTGGNITYRMTTNALADFHDLIIYAYTPSGTVLTDGTSVGAIGVSTAVNSGNMTTTGTDGVAFGSYAEFSTAVLSLPLLNGLTPDHDQTASGGGGSPGEAWAKTYTSGFTGASSATLTPSNAWGSSIIAFKISASAPERRYPRGIERGLQRGLA